MSNLLVKFLGLVPALLTALLYGRITGDMQNALAVGGLLLGMWLGVRFAGLSVKANT